MEVLSRADALERGLREYFTGRPCRNGHVAPRHVVNRVCKECAVTHWREWYDRTAEPARKYRKRTAPPSAAQKCPVARAERKRERMREWRAANRDRFAGYQKKRREDGRIRITYSLRSRLNRIVAGRRKVASATDLLGCTVEECRKHLESQFSDGMSWDNYGEWHIDHIVPLARFSFDSDEDFRRAFHFTNLQPLWARENLSKGDRLWL